MNDHPMKEKFSKRCSKPEDITKLSGKSEILTSNDIYAVASSNGKTKKTGRLKMIIRKKVNNSSSKGKTNR